MTRRAVKLTGARANRVTHRRSQDDIDRKIITMRDIKKVGDYVALVHFHKEVTAEIPVKVIAEGEPEEVAAPEVVEEAPAAVEEAPVEEAPVEEEAPAAE